MKPGSMIFAVGSICKFTLWYSICFVVVITLLIATLTFVLVTLTAANNVLLLCPDAAQKKQQTSCRNAKPPDAWLNCIIRLQRNGNYTDL